MVSRSRSRDRKGRNNNNSSKKRKKKKRSDDDDDEEIEVIPSRKKTIAKCPLTHKPFKVAVIGPCNHKFERSALENYLGNEKKGKECPLPGCLRTMTKSDLRVLIDDY